MFNLDTSIHIVWHVLIVVCVEDILEWWHLIYATSLIVPIVIHLNGTSPSECRHSLCWHIKGHLWIEVCLKHYRWAYYELHLSFIQLVIFTFKYVKCCMHLFLYATHVHTHLLLKHVMCHTRVLVIASRVQICTQVPLIETCVSYTSCQY